MTIKDPDTLINWERIDEPGDNPMWESKCGLIEQTSFGDNAHFHGYVGPDKKTPITQTYTLTLISAKKLVEKEFLRTNSVKWNYATEA